MRKPVVFISGPITGVDNYWEAFEDAENYILSQGAIPLSPAHQPIGLMPEDYMRMSMAMIDAADIVVQLPGWGTHLGCHVEDYYCEYVDKIRCALGALPLAILKWREGHPDAE